MNITYALLVLHILHALQSILICITHCNLFYNVWAGNLFNVHEDVRGRPSTWYICCFLPSLGAESRWDDRGGNSKSVRNTELMMECNDCLFEGWNEQTATTHLEVWPDKSEVETHIIQADHINDKPEGDKMLGDPGNCHHCHCPASHWLNPERSWPAKQGITRFRKVLRSLQNISNTWGVTMRENVYGWAVKQLIIRHEVKLEGSIWSSIPCWNQSPRQPPANDF